MGFTFSSIEYDYIVTNGERKHFSGTVDHIDGMSVKGIVNLALTREKGKFIGTINQPDDMDDLKEVDFDTFKLDGHFIKNFPNA